MIETPTLFIVGAGGSAPYKFPIGTGLSKRILDETISGQTIEQFVRENLGIGAMQISLFREQFRDSALYSVDAFLERRPEFMEVGKLATAHVLMRHENPNRLATFEENWLRILFNRLVTDYDQFKKNNVAFMTFNYDRNIEHFFFQALSSTYNKSPDEVRDLMQQHLPIVHLHGRLGYLPWQDAKDGDKLPYPTEVSPRALHVAARNIKIIHEDTADRDADFKEAQRLIGLAEKIVILGFGFNERNVSRLGIGDLPTGKAIASSFGMRAVALKTARDLTAWKIDMQPGDCSHFLEELIVWK